MGEKIDIVTIDSSSIPFGAVDLLHGAVEGAATRYVNVSHGVSFDSTSQPAKARIVLFLKGKGVFQLPFNKSIAVEEITLLAFVPDITFQLKAESPTVNYLEIIMNLSKDDLEEIRKKNAIINPFILKYSEAKSYTEDIKSAKTINRTLLPDGVIPRLAIGSVETAGPDKVDAHEHPMLEQFFFGLPGNNCTVFADGEETIFKEYSLLHIPLGSVHGAFVYEGSLLHYVWVDIFRNLKDMTYIKEKHHHSE